MVDISLTFRRKVLRSLLKDQHNMGGIKGHVDTNELSTMMELEKSRLSALLIIPCKNHQSMLKLIGKKVINVVNTNSCMI